MVKYSRQLMQAILCDKIQIAKAVNVKGHPLRLVVSLHR
jgi:hypothetical protein